MTDTFKDVSATFHASIPKSIIRLFQSNGGKQYRGARDTGHAGPDVHFTITTQDASSAPLVSPLWILDCIRTQTLVDVRLYAPTYHGSSNAHVSSHPEHVSFVQDDGNAGSWMRQESDGRFIVHKLPLTHGLLKLRVVESTSASGLVSASTAAAAAESGVDLRILRVRSEDL